MAELARELYVVLWDDAHGTTGMIADNEIEHKPYRFTLVGHLIKSDEVGVSVAAERGEDGLWRGHTFVPRQMVVDEWSQGPIKKPVKRKPRKPKPPPHPPLPIPT